MWIATGTSPEDIVVDATRVYWTDIGAGTVNAMPKAGGAVTVLAMGQANPRRLAVGGAYVYWSDQLGAAIMRTLADGTGTPAIVSKANQPWGIVVDSANVFWADTGSVTIARSSINGIGGPPITVRSAYTQELRTDGNLFLLATFQDPSAMFFPTDDCFLVAKANGAIYGRGFTGQGSSPPTGDSTLVFGGSVYCWDAQLVQIQGTSIATSNPTFNIGGAFDLQATNSCAIFGTNLQMAPGGNADPTWSNGLLLNVAMGLYRWVIPSTTVNRIAADDQAIYWTDKATVGKVPLP
jgi:hypothetical protein